MGYESLAHKSLKTEAKKKLKEMGFQDNEIIEEYPVKGKPRGLIIDVVGISKTKKVAFECGDLDKLKKAVLNGEIGQIGEKFDEVYHIPYSEAVLKPEFYDAGSEELIERKKYLMSVYNEEIYNKLKDDKEFAFEEYNPKNSVLFKLGQFEPWLAMPTATGTFGKNLMYEINFTLYYEGKDKFEVTINAETKPAVFQFLQRLELHENKVKLLELFHKLPDIAVIQAGFKFRPKGHHPMKPMPRNWRETREIKCNTITEDQLDEVIEYLSFVYEHGAKYRQYPIVHIVRAKEVIKSDLSTMFRLLKQLYNLLFSFETVDIKCAKELRQLPNYDWYIDEGKFDLLLEEAKDKFPDIDISKLKKWISLIKQLDKQSKKAIETI